MPVFDWNHPDRRREGLVNVWIADYSSIFVQSSGDATMMSCVLSDTDFACRLDV